MLGGQEKIYITINRLENLEQDSKDLKKARALISRLRSDNIVLKDEKKRFIATVEATKRHISIAGNVHKKYAVCLVLNLLRKSRLI